MRKLVVSLTAAFALVLGLLAASTPTRAVASPTPKPTAATARHYRWTLSSLEHNAMIRAGKVSYHTPGRTLDYRVARKYFDGSPHPVDWRRQFAAGWLYAGGSITHISSSERAAVRRRERTITNAQTCTGHSDIKYLATAWYPIQIRLNSCQTNQIIDLAEGCLGVAGAGGVATPKINSVAPRWATASRLKGTIAVAMLYCAINLVALKIARDTSPYNAVKVRIEWPWKPALYVVNAYVWPQT